MSQKRDLYRAVVHESSNNAGRRRTLAQGRLVTKSLLATGPTEATMDQNTSEICPKSFSAGSPRQGGLLHSSPRRDLSSLMASMHAEIPDTMEGESAHTPRKHQPALPTEPSPSPMKPCSSLELSDTETEPEPEPQVDSSPAFSPPEGGVYKEDIVVPNPVIHVSRHTPNPIHCDVRNTGNVAAAKRIPVDKVNNADIIVTKHSEQYAYVDSTDDASPASVKRLSPTKHLFHDEETDESVSKDKQSLTQSMDNTNKSADLGDKKNQAGHSRISDVSMASIPEEGTKKRVKKKPPKVVKSRYMSSLTTDTSTKKGPMKATDRSVLGKANMSSSATNVRLQSSVKALPKRKTATKSSSSTKVKADTKTFSLTPEVRGKSHSKASTPSAEDVSLYPLGGVDVSAIAHHGHHGKHHSSLFSTPGQDGSSIEASTLHSPKDKSSLRMFKSHDTKHSQISEGYKSDAPSKRTVEAVQNQLTASYCRYLQWAYLDAKSQKAARAQEKVVMDQLYSLSLECEKLEKEKVDKKLELERLKHLTALDDVLDLQEKVLSPIVDNLPELEKQYKTLAGALDTTRHQLPIRGVHLPDDDLLDSIEQGLEESEQLLSELDRITRQHAPSIRSFSQSLKTVKSTAQTEVDLLAKVQELVSASQTLITHESSLLIQDMHSDSYGADTTTL